MATGIWLRAETKPLEKRTALTPESATALVEAGFEVVVERSQQSCIPAHLYEQVGCSLVDAGTWRDAPEDTFVLGLKELPEDGSALKHRHIFFGHAYKDQDGWQETLGRFVRGGGALYDLEYLVNEQGRRVAAFGYWAGFAGAAVAAKAWCGQQVGSNPVVPVLHDYPSRDVLVDEVRNEVSRAVSNGGSAARVMVIGARGRSGSGAVDFSRAVGLEVTEWDMEETQMGGPFTEILDHEIFVNCVLVSSDLPPFITNALIDGQERRLTVVSDVSCDPLSDYNPVPLYKTCTSFETPALRLREGSPPLDLVAIDHLPSMLPLEASEDFSQQLLPTLLELHHPGRGVWQRARDVFDEKSKSL